MNLRVYNAKDISTHSLTRRLTYLTSQERNGTLYFNSQPHEEADCSEPAGYIHPGCISTHSLTRRLTTLQRFASSIILSFQLTASRGG